MNGTNRPPERLGDNDGEFPQAPNNVSAQNDSPGSPRFPAPSPDELVRIIDDLRRLLMPGEVQSPEEEKAGEILDRIERKLPELEARTDRLMQLYGL